MNLYKHGAQRIVELCWKFNRGFKNSDKFPAILGIATFAAICAILGILLIFTAILPLLVVLDFAAKFSHGGAFLACVVLFVVLWLVR